MDVAAKVVVFAQATRHFHQLLHGVVGRLDDAAGQEQPLNAVAAVKVQRQRHHLGCGEPRALHIGTFAVDAVAAVVNAHVRQQDFEQRNTAPIGRVAVADSRAFDRAHTFAAQRGSPLHPAGRTAGVVFGGVGQDAEFGDGLHTVL